MACHRTEETPFPDALGAAFFFHAHCFSPVHKIQFNGICDYRRASAARKLKREGKMQSLSRKTYRQQERRREKAGERRLAYREHFILRNLVRYLPYYAALWLACVALSLLLIGALDLESVVQYDLAKTFATSLMTISVTTITFAIPTCIRTVFATYETYYSTTIRQLLLERMPITLLAVSAFTSLLMSMCVISGIFGTYIPMSPALMFLLSTFWGLVCVAYLFIALEKMVYFIVRSPNAVLDKLQFAVGEQTIESKEEYSEFRHRLASINDIATVVVQRSTGRDELIVECLESFEKTHAKYIRIYLGNGQSDSRRWHLSACRAVLTEMLRIYRTACQSKNDRVTKAALRSYCRVIVDSAAAGCSGTYFRELMSRVDKCQTYAAASGIDEIEEQANFLWYFYLAEVKPDGFLADQVKHQASVTRTLSGALRRLTLDGNENLIARFAQIASNTDVEYDIEALSPYWLAMLDQAVFIYLMWLLGSEPSDATRYLSYIRAYSVVDADFARPLLCDSECRFSTLIEGDRIRRLNAASARNAYRSGSNGGKAVAGDAESACSGQQSLDLTAAIMGMDATEEIPHTLAMMIEMRYAGVQIDGDALPHSYREEMVRGMKAMEEALAKEGEPEAQDVAHRMELAGVVSMDIRRWTRGDAEDLGVETASGEQKLEEESGAAERM